MYESAETLKIELEFLLDKPIPYDSEIMDWLIFHSADILNRTRMMQNGKTPYHMVKGRQFSASVARFGEIVFYLRANSKGKDRLNSRVNSGIYLGHLSDSGEAKIGTAQGVIRARTIRRKALFKDRWNAANVFKMKGRPSQPNPLSSSKNIYSLSLIHI